MKDRGTQEPETRGQTQKHTGTIPCTQHSCSAYTEGRRVGSLEPTGERTLTGAGRLLDISGGDAGATVYVADTLRVGDFYLKEITPH